MGFQGVNRLGDRGSSRNASGMKNTLQYAYTITVFIGVLFTAYLMMNREGNARIPLRAFENSGLRSEAAVDPGVNQLFEMEDAFNKLPKEKRPSQNRSSADVFSNPNGSPTTFRR